MSCNYFSLCVFSSPNFYLFSLVNLDRLKELCGPVAGSGSLVL